MHGVISALQLVRPPASQSAPVLPPCPPPPLATPPCPPPPLATPPCPPPPLATPPWPPPPFATPPCPLLLLAPLDELEVAPPVELVVGSMEPPPPWSPGGESPPL